MSNTEIGEVPLNAAQQVSEVIMEGIKPLAANYMYKDIATGTYTALYATAKSLNIDTKAVIDAIIEWHNTLETVYREDVNAREKG